MQLSDLTVEIRDGNLRRIGAIRPEDLNLTATLNFNNVGQWQVTLPTSHPMADPLCTPGNGLVVYGPTDEMFSGPTTAPTLNASSTDPHGTLTIVGVTDDVILSDYLALPNPSAADTAQTGTGDVRTGVTEDLMQAFVNANCGPGARADRRTGTFAQFLTMGANGHRGTATTKTALFDQLGPMLSDMAAVDGLGFRVIQRGAGLVFETFKIVDRTSFIVLDLWNNTVSSQTSALTGPTVTRAYVGGTYLGTTPDSLSGETEWKRRIEKYQQDAGSTADDTQAAAEVLADGGATGSSVKITPSGNTTMVFGRDWYLGDKIAVLGGDVEYSAPVTSVAISATPSGFGVGALLGDASRLSDVAHITSTLNTALRQIQVLQARS